MESSKVVAVQLAFDVLLLPFGRCHTMIHTPQCLVSYHTRLVAVHLGTVRVN
jgi:hypothetical protein